MKLGEAEKEKTGAAGERGRMYRSSGMLRPSSSPSVHGSRGFTLIEILVVIVIIGILSAAMVPMFDGGVETARARGNLDRITNMMNLCASMAASDAQPYRLLFDEEEGAFQILFEENPVEEPEQFVPLQMSDMSSFQLDDSMAIKAWKIEGYDPESNELPYIEFRPDGTADRAAIVLETGNGEAWTVIVSPMTSALRIHGYDLSEEEDW